MGFGGYPDLGAVEQWGGGPQCLARWPNTQGTNVSVSQDFQHGIASSAALRSQAENAHFVRPRDSWGPRRDGAHGQRRACRDCRGALVPVLSPEFLVPGVRQISQGTGTAPEPLQLLQALGICGTQFPNCPIY